MQSERKGFGTKVAEVSQKLDIVTSGVAIVGSSMGLIPVGFTITLLGFNTLTYLGAEALKDKKRN